jgi:type III pantothenate kinase
MNLAIDLGNTRAKLAVFEENKIIKEFYTYDFTREFLLDILDKFEVKNSIISSVVHHKSEIAELLGQKTFFVELTSETPTGLTLDYQTPETLGRDRIAVAVGAVDIAPNKNILIADIGSCMTLDLVTADRVFCGGNIAPGFGMRIRAMHDYTAKLPMAELREPDNLLGKTTSQAVLNGAYWGIVAEINFIFELLQKEYLDLVLILTGGDAHFFAGEIKYCTFASPNLLLFGLNRILDNLLEINL